MDPSYKSEDASFSSSQRLLSLKLLKLASNSLVEVKRPLPGKGNGTKRNPVRSNDEVLQLCHAKEVTYAQLNGTPGLTFRSGKTMHSYQWSPIAPASPIGTSTRTKFKS